MNIMNDKSINQSVFKFNDSSINLEKSDDSENTDTENGVQTDTSPNHSLFNKTNATGNDDEYRAELDESTLEDDAGDVSSNDENIFNWDGVNMKNIATFVDSHPLRCCRFSYGFHIHFVRIYFIHKVV